MTIREEGFKDDGQVSLAGLDRLPVVKKLAIYSPSFYINVDFASVASAVADVVVISSHRPTSTQQRIALPSTLLRSQVSTSKVR